MTENNRTLEEMQKIINGLVDNESDSSNTSIIPNYLLTYTDIRNGAIPNLTSSDAIFHFSNYGKNSPCSISSFANNKIDQLFFLNRGDNKIQIGSDSINGIGIINNIQQSIKPLSLNITKY
jgi:hypothetical protein